LLTRGQEWWIDVAQRELTLPLVILSLDVGAGSCPEFQPLAREKLGDHNEVTTQNKAGGGVCGKQPGRKMRL